MSQQDHEKNKRLRETIQDLLAGPPVLGYCERHSWLHEKDFGPTPPCRNWQARATPNPNQAGEER